MQQKNLPAVSDMIAIDKRADEIFDKPTRNETALKYISSPGVPGGANLLKAIQMGTKKENDPEFLRAVQVAKDLYRKNYLQGTRTSGGSSGVQSGADFLSSLGG